jgi:hypothetical protein
MVWLVIATGPVIAPTPKKMILEPGSLEDIKFILLLQKLLFTKTGR